jgi:lipoprotein-anchoring transpeptidase ErfK/SrfK
MAALLLTAACNDSGGFFTPGSNGKSNGALAPAKIEVSGLSRDATNVPISTEFPITTSGSISSVALTDSNGKTVQGGFARGDNTWVPSSQLSYRTKYQLHVMAVAQGRIQNSYSSEFTTSAPPSRTTSASIQISDGQTVGVGMPIIVNFGRSVPSSQRAAVERRMFVTANPATEGSWHWYSGTEVHYRPKDYWKPGTTVSVRLALGGVEIAHKRYARDDVTARFSISSSLITRVDNATHTATVYKDGQVIKTMPVSLGKSSAPTSTGTHVVMEKFAQKIFDSETFGLSHEDGGYRVNVFWDVRFTWGGEFVHAAPWSVGEQGKRNVSHGCVNVSTANAKWFYDLATRGDVIEVVGTERKTKPGDGWTDWDLSWKQYKAGSALK